MGEFLIFVVIVGISIVVVWACKKKIEKSQAEERKTLKDAELKAAEQRRQLGQWPDRGSIPAAPKLFKSDSRLISSRDIGPVTFSVSSEYRVYENDTRQRTSGVLPAMSLASWDNYISPSGGFVNYARFDVVGKNPETKRKNKRYIEAKDEADACKKMEKKGFIGPFEVTVLSIEPPTERQLEYAKSLGAVIPKGACKRDVSAIIARITENDEQPVSDSKARAAFFSGLKLSRYSGTHEIMSLANSLPAEEFSKILRS